MQKIKFEFIRYQMLSSATLIRLDPNIQVPPCSMDHGLETILILFFQLPEVEDDEDEEFKQQTQQLKNMIPFAVVGSTQLIEVKGKKVRGRLYPWGVVEVENPEHCDFTGLRTMLM